MPVTNRMDRFPIYKRGHNSLTDMKIQYEIKGNNKFYSSSNIVLELSASLTNIWLSLNEPLFTV